MLFSENESPARNADPRLRETLLFPGHVLSENKTPARNADQRDITFSWACCFPSKTRAPARNADPRGIAFFLGILFSEKEKAPARNADPNTRAFCRPEHHRLFQVMIFSGKQKPLIGTPIRVG